MSNAAAGLGFDTPNRFLGATYHFTKCTLIFLTAFPPFLLHALSLTFPPFSHPFLFFSLPPILFTFLCLVPCLCFITFPPHWLFPCSTCSFTPPQCLHECMNLGLTHCLQACLLWHKWKQRPQYSCAGPVAMLPSPRRGRIFYTLWISYF